MAWVAWRQHRLQVLAMAAIIAALAGYLIHLTLPMVPAADAYHTCVTTGTEGACQRWFEYMTRVTGQRADLTLILALTNVLPALVGAFWGAPLLAREYERGTYRLAWTQSITRTRWLAVKLTGLAAAVIGGVAQAVLMTWVVDNWRVIGTINRFSDPTLFDLTGVVPPALWLCGLTLGTAAGILLRRTTTAMAATMATLALVLIGLNLARPHYMAPATRVVNDTAEGIQAVRIDEDWRLGRTIRNADGTILADRDRQRTCPLLTPPCAAQHGLQLVERYHPADRFTRFQWTENAILLTITVLVAGTTVARIRRRAD